VSVCAYVCFRVASLPGVTTILGDGARNLKVKTVLYVRERQLRVCDLLNRQVAV
jgi:hypothetical protein